MLNLILAFSLSANLPQTDDIVGRQMLKKMVAAVKQSAPITGVLTSTKTGGRPERATFKAMLPRYLVISAATSKKHGHDDFDQRWSDKGTYVHMPGRPGYFENSAMDLFAPPELRLIGMEGAFSKEFIYSKIQRPRPVSFNGHDAYEIRCQTPEQAGPINTTLFLAKDTLMPLGYVQGFSSKDAASRVVYSNLKLHANLRKAEFYPPVAAGRKRQRA